MWFPSVRITVGEVRYWFYLQLNLLLPKNKYAKRNDGFFNFKSALRNHISHPTDEFACSIHKFYFFDRYYFLFVLGNSVRFLFITFTMKIPDTQYLFTSFWGAGHPLYFVLFDNFLWKKKKRYSLIYVEKNLV